MNIKKTQKNKGYTLIEVIIILLIFTSMFLVMMVAFQNSIKNLNRSKAKIVAVEMANAQMEILRNLTYGDLGTVSGSPTGTIPDSKQIIRSSITYTVNTKIIYIDDPFDGCVGEPDDPITYPPDEYSKCADGTQVNKSRDIPDYSNNPADYKKCDVEVVWDQYYFGNPVKISTILAPKHLEGDTDKGYLLISVINSSGEVVADASVNVINTQVDPNVNINMTTDISGNFLLLDLEPSDSYTVKVSKNGYSNDRTCAVQVDGTACTDSEGVPDPVQGNVSVYQGKLEEVTFIIDKYATLAVNSYTESCVALPNIEFTLQGIKKISDTPPVLKNIIDFQTNGDGQWNKNDVEWDLYDLIINTAGYDIAGVNHDLALNILADTNTTLNVILANQSTNSLLITVKDSGTGLSLANANVQLTKTGYDETKITGQGFIVQTEWSGGDGQIDFIDDTKYFSDDSHLDTTSTTGQTTLRKNSPTLFFSEDFNTGTYKDGANTNADWNTSDEELKLPTFSGDYPVDTMYHAQTFKINSQYGKIVKATLTANEQLNGKTINYYLSADGGTNFESVVLGSAHTFTDIGDDIRIRVELETDDKDITPIVYDLSLNYDIEYFDVSGELISSTFDLGSAADFTTLQREPISQPIETGTDSVKIQIATNNDQTTWNFIGPDGTGSTYYTAVNSDLHDSHNGDQYIRYKLFISTEDIFYTPIFSNINIGYTLECLPPGQVYFKNLQADPDYLITASLDGYQNEITAVEVDGYTKQEILLTPST